MARAIPRLLLSAALLLSGTAFAEEPAPAPAAPPPAPATPPPASAPAPTPSAAPAATPKPPATPAPPAIRPLPPANPFGELGAASLVGGTFSLGVLIGCAASNINPSSQSQCLLASGLTGVGLILVGVPLILVGRSRNMALAPRVTFVAQARGGVLGYSGSF